MRVQLGLFPDLMLDGSHQLSCLIQVPSNRGHVKVGLIEAQGLNQVDICTEQLHDASRNRTIDLEMRWEKHRLKAVREGMVEWMPNCLAS